jgi:mRNA-degrading endonuclease RelE of RelBE toxin-antitoxin system
MGHNAPMQTVAETAHYSHRADKLLSEEERDKVITAIACDPLAGDLIEGTGGLRKIRFGKGNRGKSGGVRVIYYYHDLHMPTLLVVVS